MQIAAPTVDQTDLAAFLGIETDSLVTAVREGLPFDVYERLSSMLELGSRDLAALLSISERTLRRRKHAGKLETEESDRVLRLARILELAVMVFEGESARAVQWLTAPATLLGGESPLTRTDTEPGAREVEDMLYTIEFTMPA